MLVNSFDEFFRLKPAEIEIAEMPMKPKSNPIRFQMQDPDDEIVFLLGMKLGIK